MNKQTNFIYFFIFILLFSISLISSQSFPLTQTEINRIYTDKGFDLSFENTNIEITLSDKPIQTTFKNKGNSIEWIDYFEIGRDFPLFWEADLTKKIDYNIKCNDELTQVENRLYCGKIELDFNDLTKEYSEVDENNTYIVKPQAFDLTITKNTKEIITEEGITYSTKDIKIGVKLKDKYINEIDKDKKLKLGDKKVHDPTYSITNFTNGVLNNVQCEGNYFCHSGINDSSVVLYLPFDVQEKKTDNITYDFTNNNNDGTLNGGVLWNMSGVNNTGAYQFDGVNDYVSVADNTNLRFGTNDFTLSAWVYINKLVGGGIVLSKDSAGQFYALRIVSNTIMDFIILPSGGSPLSAYSPTLQTGQWYHFVGVADRDGNSVLYTNGVAGTPKNISLNSTLSISPTTALRIGYSSGFVTPVYFNGSIDEVMIFNRSLNSSEISQLYNQQFPRFYPTSYTNQTLHPIKIDSGYNKLNVSINQSNQLGTNLSIRLGMINKSLDDLTGEVLHMPFEWNSPTAWDIAGNNDGSLVGGVLWNATGGLNQSGGYQFDGVDDYVQVLNSSSVDITTAPLSIFAWVYSKGGSNSGYIINKNLDSSANNQYGIYKNPTTNEIDIYLEGSTIRANSEVNSVPNNVWTFVGFTWNGSDVRPFINGVQNGSTGTYTGSLTSQLNLAIGRRAPSNLYFNGSIDEVMIFNRSLSQTEITQMYQRQSTKYNQIVYTNEVNITKSNVFDISTDASYVFPFIKYGTDSFRANTPILVSAFIMNTSYLNPFPTFSNYIENPINDSVYLSGTNYKFNVTILDTNGTAGLEFNGNNYTLTNISSIFNSSVGDLSAGTYPYYWYATNEYGNYNTSRIKYYTIGKATPILTLTSSAGWTILASTYSTITGSNCPAQLTCSLFEVYESVANPYTKLFAAGSYYFNFNTSGNINWTNYNIYNSLISQVNSTSGINGTVIGTECRKIKPNNLNMAQVLTRCNT